MTVTEAVTDTDTFGPQQGIGVKDKVIYRIIRPEIFLLGCPSTILTILIEKMQLVGRSLTPLTKQKAEINLKMSRIDGKTFQCNHCPKSFIVPSTFRIHLRSHSGEKPFICKECSKPFSQLSHLRTHLRTHSGA